MERWAGRVAVVTGASSGIGASIAEALAREGMIVVGLARRKNRLQDTAEALSIAKGKLYPVQCDVSNEQEILDAFRWIRDHLGAIDVLVNNAGVAHFAHIISGDTEGFRRVLDVNVLAVAICTREAVANMRARRVDGHIININSVTGHAIPNLPNHLSLYPSSKYALTAMTEVVRRELISAKTNIKVTSLSPGLVKTEIMEAAEYCVENTGSPDAPTLQAKDISDAVLYILSTPPNVQDSSLRYSYVDVDSVLANRIPTLCRDMERWADKVAVVTGASAGIGAEVVKALVKKGFTVVGLARRKNRVQELATELKEEPGKLHACECDLTKEEDILAAFRWIKAQWGGVDVLVNNAGVFKLSTLTNGHTEDWKHILDINVLAVCICTRESMQLMEDREHCHVINICSVAGHRIPNLVPSFLHVYPASKHALRAISDSLRAECARNKRRIKVTNLSPGTVQTEMAAGLGNLSEKLTEEDMAELSQHKVTLQSKDIADAVLYVLETPPHVEIRELIIEPLGAVL